MKKLILILWLIPFVLSAQTKLTYKTSQIQTMLDNVYGVTSPVQGQLNARVSKVDSVTGPNAFVTDHRGDVIEADLNNYTTLDSADGSGASNTYVSGKYFNTAMALKANTTDVIFTISSQAGAFAAPADATTYYFNQFSGSAPNQTANARISVIPINCTLVGYAIATCVGAGGCSQEASILSMRINNTTDIQLSDAVTFSTTAGAGTTVYNMGLSTSLTAGDTWQIKWLTPTWATNPTSVDIYITLFFKVR